MLPFFRKIRYRLAKDNQFMKYSRYAIGEIVLVVVGILLALQVNNWNEERELNKLELKILKDLKAELSENQDRLESTINDYRLILSRTKELSEYISPNSSLIEVEEFNKLLLPLLWPPQYDPSEGVYKAVISSGNLSIIRNDELKYSLSELSGIVNRYHRNAKLDYDNLHNHIAPFIMNKYNLKNIPLFDALGKSKFDIDPNILATSFKFESQVVLRWGNVNGTKNIAENLFKVQGELIKMIDEELMKQNR